MSCNCQKVIVQLMITQIFIFILLLHVMYIVNICTYAYMFRGTHGRLANTAKCAVLFKYCINKNISSPISRDPTVFQKASHKPLPAANVPTFVCHKKHCRPVNEM